MMQWIRRRIFLSKRCYNNPEPTIAELQRACVAQASGGWRRDGGEASPRYLRWIPYTSAIWHTEQLPDSMNKGRRRLRGYYVYAHGTPRLCERRACDAVPARPRPCSRRYRRGCEHFYKSYTFWIRLSCPGRFMLGLT